jgi:hypothetical protein
LVRKDFLEKKARKARKVFRVRRVNVVPLVLEVLQEIKAQSVRKVHQGIRVQEAHRDRLVQLVRLVCLMSKKLYFANCLRFSPQRT